MISDRDSEPNVLLGLEPGESNINWNNTLFIIEHRHAKRARVIYLVIGVFVELFTVMFTVEV